MRSGVERAGTGGGNDYGSRHLHGSPVSRSAAKRNQSLCSDVEATFVCSSDDDLDAAENVMNEKKVRRLPVLDKQSRLVGLLSLSDIAECADHEYVRGTVTR